MTQELGKEAETKLAPFYWVTSLTQEQAKSIVNTLWAKAPLVERNKAALICAMYGLNPLMKHLYLIPFKDKKTGIVTWAAVLGIGATRLIASRKTQYTYLDGPRMMTEREQERIRGEVDDSKWWAITILQDDKGNKSPGYGSWSKSDTPYGIEKGNTGQNMAMIRSERNAFDRLLPGEMPAGVEVIDTSFVEVTAGDSPKQEGLFKEDKP